MLDRMPRLCCCVLSCDLPLPMPRSAAADTDRLGMLDLHGALALALLGLGPRLWVDIANITEKTRTAYHRMNYSSALHIHCMLSSAERPVRLRAVSHTRKRAAGDANQPATSGAAVPGVFHVI